MTLDPHRFGGEWTAKKLSILREYLKAYSTALSNRFNTYYIDAFAGTGYVNIEPPQASEDLFENDQLQEFHRSGGILAGSAIMALEIKPRLGHYIFIERKRSHYNTLRVVTEGLGYNDNVLTIIHGDANESVKALTRQSWNDSRAVLFLDPYGMQIDFKTLEAVALTKSFDVFILFPSGIAVNRMLTRSGNIDEKWRIRLNRIFGTSEWYDRFYRTTFSSDLLDGEISTVEKCANIEQIVAYYIERLGSCFPVARSAGTLADTSGKPLYHLCFALANTSQKAIDLATRFVDSISKRHHGD